MSLEFNLDTKESKSILNPEGVGLGAGGSEINHTSPPIPTYSISVKEGSVHNSDVEKTYVGPLAGAGAGSAQASHNEDFHGFSTPTGNKIHINGEAGSETIELIHHTGAAIVIDSDGGIFIIPSGKKGFGLNSGDGDGVISAGQRIIIKGNSGITVETDGDLEFNVGGSMHVDVSGDYAVSYTHLTLPTKRIV